MNTVEHLKAEAREKYFTDDVSFGIRLRMKTTRVDGKQFYKTVTESDIADLIEHTHTQTIQSVRERIEGRRREVGQNVWDEEGLDIFKAGYNQALTDLLKDLEAPVEGDGPMERLQNGIGLTRGG
jgi:hypothetical protein